MIAPAYAIKFPNRVLSVGLLSTVAGRSDVDKNNVLKIISEMEKTGVEQTLQKLTTRWFTDEFIEENPDLVKTRLKQVIDTDPEVFLNVFKIYANTEMITWLKNISKPCLLMTGENDLGCSPDHNKRMAIEILNSKLVILPKYKHSFLIEAPKEVAKNLIEFIKSI
jgi:pimeloyl-ACP methyl ester carboxylesterase